MTGTVLSTTDAGIATLTINRPEKRNALNAQTRRALLEALSALESREDARVVVIRGAGDKAFAAGADIEELSKRTLHEQRAYITPPHIYEAVARFPKPVIAAINGHALGAGCELAMACDVRVAASTAKIGQPEINLGIIPGGGGTQRLPRLVGAGRAAYLVFTGEAIDASTAERWGLVDEVVASQSLEARVREIALKMAEKSPIALRLSKEALRAAAESDLPRGLAQEIDLFALAFQSDEAKAQIRAFLEKR